MTATDDLRWASLLDELALGAAACLERYVRGGDVDLPVPVSFAPPVDLGPLPATLETRAREVLSQLHAAEARVARVPRPGALPRATRFSGRGHVRATFERDA
jgi:hypothetical protein